MIVHLYTVILLNCFQNKNCIQGHVTIKYHWNVEPLYSALSYHNQLLSDSLHALACEGKYPTVCAFLTMGHFTAHLTNPSIMFFSQSLPFLLAARSPIFVICKLTNHTFYSCNKIAHLYTIHRKGLSFDPCGTQTITGYQLQKEPLTITLYLLSPSQFQIYAFKLHWISWALSVCTNIPFLTVRSFTEVHLDFISHTILTDTLICIYPICSCFSSYIKVPNSSSSVFQLSDTCCMAREYLKFSIRAPPLLPITILNASQPVFPSYVLWEHKDI